MTNKQLIKYAHIVALVVLLACGLWAVAGSAGVSLRSQNSNQNGNGNGNGNGNTNSAGNANRSQNQNANTAGNTNSRNANATGSQTGMGNLSSQDRNFIMRAAMSGMMEVELGRMATERGASDAVKQFGQRMVDDHTKANTELMSLAANKGITLPTALDEKHQEHVTKLSGMSGMEFDRAYARLMVNEHDRDVDTFERASERGVDPDLKAFASRTLPVLQEHLQMARTLDGGQRGNDNSNSGGTRNSNRNSNRNNNGNGNSNRP